MDWTGGGTPWSAARTPAMTARSMSPRPREPAMPAFHLSHLLSPQRRGVGAGGGGAARFEATAVGVVSLGI